MKNLPETFLAWVIREHEDGSFRHQVESCRMDALPPGDVLIRVAYSSLNYKDMLSLSGNKGVTRHFPHTPGIDAAGTVAASSADAFPLGMKVLVTGYDLGMNTHGGLGEFIRVPADWVLPLPSGLSMSQAMALGTAGFTAALSLAALKEGGAAPEQGDVLVTGASGGVGCLAVLMLARAGFQVSASTGKSEAHALLKALGAQEVLGREDVLVPLEKPLVKGRWSHVIDTVGGSFLDSALRALRPGGTVTTCGMASSPDLTTNVYPFILRGARLQGIDSVATAMGRRRDTWAGLTDMWTEQSYASVVNEWALDQLDTPLLAMQSGQLCGRTLIRVCGD